MWTKTWNAPIFPPPILLTSSSTPSDPEGTDAPQRNRHPHSWVATSRSRSPIPVACLPAATRRRRGRWSYDAHVLLTPSGHQVCRHRCACAPDDTGRPGQARSRSTAGAPGSASGPVQAMVRQCPSLGSGCQRRSGRRAPPPGRAGLRTCLMRSAPAAPPTFCGEPGPRASRSPRSPTRSGRVTISRGSPRRSRSGGSPGRPTVGRSRRPPRRDRPTSG
jgi:hypothetical protein